MSDPETFEPPTEEAIGEAVVIDIVHLPSGCVNDGVQTQVYYPLNSAGLYMRAPIVCGYCHCEMKIRGTRNALTANGKELLRNEQQEPMV